MTDAVLSNELSGESWTCQESTTLGYVGQFCLRTPWLALELFVECGYSIEQQKQAPFL